MREVYRILDANFNRAREAMRVVEDFARFVLDDPALSGLAKDLRSRLQQAYETFPPGVLVAHRDTPGDVGTALTSPTEGVRQTPADVATAACKRMTEALRTLEEYAKIANCPLPIANCEDNASGPACGAADSSIVNRQSTIPALLESLRYSAYELERRLAHRLATASRFDSVRLYVLLTSALCRKDPIDTARAAIAGGADCIQLREKTMPSRELLALAKRLRELTARAGVLFIMNDRPDVAALCGADGLHVGQEDLSVAEARRFLPPGTLVGVSTHNIAQARAAVADGADYIGVGPMFATTTKDAGPLAGPDYLRQVVNEIHLPHVAIGGITAANVGELIQAGAHAVAVCSAVISAQDPAAAGREIKAKLPVVPTDRIISGRSD